MPDPVDIYSDQFQITIGPYGCLLNFSALQPQPPPQGTMPQADRLATVRMSLEHLKVLAYLLRGQLLVYEQQAGIKVPLPSNVLNGLGIGREDWDAFWRQGANSE